MKRFAPYASLVIATLVTGCGGFTSLGDGGGAGAAGMANAAGTGMGDTGGENATGGTGMSTGGTGMGTGGTGMSTGGTGMGAGGTGMSTGGTGMGTGGTGMSTGGTGMGTGGTGGYQPCAGRPCGSNCTLCDPNDAMCVQDKSVRYCDADAVCGTSFPMCGGTTECTTRMDCVVPALCQICADGSASCPTADCVAGKCVTTFPTCSGTECMIDGDCPVSEAPCQMCPDGTTACPWAHCDGGKCTSGIDSCGASDPCRGKSCGDRCTTCTGTACDAVAMTCDENLKCQLNQPKCIAPQCQSNMDCNTDVCGLCASTGGCANQVCVDGQCTFSCPPPKMDLCGGCLADEVCVDQIGGPAISMSGAYHCVKPPMCPNAAMDPCFCVQGEGTCTYHNDAGGWCECDNGIR